MTWTIRLQEAFKLALSLALFYGFALWMNWDLPKYGGLAISLIALGTAGASMQKGAMRMVGTTAGLVVGLLLLALVAQERWLNLAFIAGYLVLVGYGIQGSRFGYAWFVAGFLPPLVWATAYGDVESGFHYAVFRYLETSVGILLYTLVGTLLWPRTAGAQLDRLGDEFLEDRRKLFGLFRRQLEDGELPAEASALRTRVAGLRPQVAGMLRAAFTDTRSVKENKHAWEELNANSEALSSALTLWAECIDDCRRLDRQRLMPWLGATLDVLERRQARIVELWRLRSAAGNAGVEEGPADADHGLLELAVPRLERSILGGLSHFECATLLAFVRQLRALDETTRATLRTLRVVAGIDPVPDAASRARPGVEVATSSWDPIRFRIALFPAVCFTVGYLFWIVTDPPAGPTVVSMAATFSLLVLINPVNLLSLMPALLGVMWLVIAPIYFFLMPWLDSGVGLLAFIFGYTFVCSLVGTVSPGVKMWGLLLFVMLTGISNDQVYSFPGLLDGAWMFVLAIGIVAGVQMLSSPVRPEQILLAGMRRFFRGCAGITGEYALSRPEDRARARAARRRFFGSMVEAEPARLRALVKKLDPALFQNYAREDVQRLVEAMQSVVFRLRALEQADVEAARRSREWTRPIAHLGDKLGQALESIFERWSRFEPTDPQEERALLLELARDFEAELDAVVSPDDPEGPEGPEELDDEALADLYAVLGCARGLIHAARDAQGPMLRIHWDELAEARF